MEALAEWILSHGQAGVIVGLVALLCWFAYKSHTNLRVDRETLRKDRDFWRDTALRAIRVGEQMGVTIDRANGGAHNGKEGDRGRDVP